MRLLAALALWLAAAPATAQTAPPLTVTSPAPAEVSVTLYRDPSRREGAIDARFPGGFALVTERRRVRLPAGPAVIRFEGVAAGILPESAVVTGLPAGVREKNLDADLLSPRSLYERSLGRRVLVRRTDRASGRVVGEPAVIRSSGDGAAVIETAAGIETLRCTGLAEAIVYPAVPTGLPARPTLSIATDAAAPAEVEVTLAYLAGGFDWQANHVLTFGPDGRADWSARVTLVSGDSTRFEDAGLQLVAGQVDREAAEDPLIAPAGPLRLSCWATDSPPPPPPPPPPPRPMAAAPQSMRAADIVVTGMRVELERLGDLKLYRAPRPVTVRARATKQIGLFDRAAVPVERRYRTEVEGDAPITRMVLTVRNDEAARLGIPVPAGPVAVFSEGAARPVLVGESEVADLAVGERIEIRLPPSPDVTATIEAARIGGGGRRMALTVANATPRAIDYELRIAVGARETLVPGKRMRREDGRWVWRARLPANGRAGISWTVRPLDPDRPSG